MKRMWNIFIKGLVKENPLLMLMIGLCSAVAVTTSVPNGIGMGLAMTFVIVFAEFVISLFRKLIPSDARIPIFIIVIAAFTTMVDLSMQAYFPALSKSMGVFIPLIVVNCIIMGRVEAFASKEKPLDAVVDALGMGIGYTWVLIGIAAIRELLGNGSLLAIRVLPESFQPILFFTLPPGGFMVFALFISFNLWLKRVIAARTELTSAREAA
ncbi:MAG: electron transport complex subunit RsxE [Spirochaetae bacterium HGW-Spirochaetae-7]|jgi:electron transport complex protein RnfE|nr:MAG: electron transport complex subunit RsxE [Spirochaetae bacterium HGW-Spirochaetae-7]